MNLNLGVVLEKGVLLEKKKEGDKKTPKGNFEIGSLYYKKNCKEKQLNS